MWDQVVLVKGDGQPFYNSWIVLGFGILVFVFFGFGKEAIAMYRTCLLALRLDKVFPGLNPNCRNDDRSAISSFICKLKSLFKRTDASPVSEIWTSGTLETLTSSKTDSLSPKKITFFETLPERIRADGRYATNEARSTTAANIEVIPDEGRRHFCGGRVVSLMHSGRSGELEHREDASSATQLSGDPMTLRSTVENGDVSGHRSLEVIVRKEVRQGSEHVESLPATVNRAS